MGRDKRFVCAAVSRGEAVRERTNDKSSKGVARDREEWWVDDISGRGAAMRERNRGFQQYQWLRALLVIPAARWSSRAGRDISSPKAA